MAEGGSKVGIALLGCGGILVLLSLLSSAFWGFHTFIDPRGAISGDEAAPGFLGSCCCFFVSMAIAVGGGVAMASAKKKAAAAAQQ